VQSLLPGNSTIAARNVLADLTTVAELEPSQFVMTIQDPSNPTDTRFLHVLQGSDAGVAMVPATYIQSTGGASFDGAVFGASAVYFPVSVTASFGGTTLTVPTGVHNVYVAGLGGGASYGVTTQSVAGGTAVIITPGGSSTAADAAGLLSVKF
jgi:hypothetical protein